MHWISRSIDETGHSFGNSETHRHVKYRFGEFDRSRDQAAAARTLRCEMSELELLVNMVLGLVGEAGEIADYIKKVEFHKHTFRPEQMTEELGDLMWYIAALCEIYGLSLEGVAQMNIAKLRDRYPNGFTVEDSQNRTD